MIVFGISASQRAWGNCETATKIVLSAASRSGARTGLIRLTDLDVQPCRGCFKCLGETARCPLPDDLYGLLGDVAGADCLVLASPVYFMKPPAAMVGLLDRLLTMGGNVERPGRKRRAVTVTIMGNRGWRGVTEPLVNITASLLGFDVSESLSLVAEGPGEVAMDDALITRLEDLGGRLARGDSIEPEPRRGLCPVCRSDFFRIEPPHVTCPLCGSRGDLERLVADGVFIDAGQEPRWGLAWLNRHIDSWIKPSIVRHVERRRSVLRKLRNIKHDYAEAD